jgi:hypothetical protein
LKSRRMSFCIASGFERRGKYSAQFLILADNVCNQFFS